MSQRLYSATPDFNEPHHVLGWGQPKPTRPSTSLVYARPCMNATLLIHRCYFFSFNVLPYGFERMITLYNMAISTAIMVMFFSILWHLQHGEVLQETAFEHTYRHFWLEIYRLNTVFICHFSFLLSVLCDVSLSLSVNRTRCHVVCLLCLRPSCPLSLVSLGKCHLRILTYSHYTTVATCKHYHKCNFAWQGRHSQTTSKGFE